MPIPNVIWYEDNSMDIIQEIIGSGDAATVTATILDAAGEAVGDPITLDPTGTADEYSASVHPAGDYDLSSATRYRLRITASYGGASLEYEETFTPRVRRGS